MNRLRITLVLLLIFAQTVYASMPYNATMKSRSTCCPTFNQSTATPPQPRRRSGLIMRYLMQHPVETVSAPRPGRPVMLPAPVKRIPLNRILPYIDSVFIQGGIDLQIVGNQPVNKIALRAAYSGLTIKVCGTAVYILSLIHI